MSERGLTIGNETARCTFCGEADRLFVQVDPAIGRVVITCYACHERSFRVMPIRDEAGREIAPPQESFIVRPVLDRRRI
jgi:hypothetical protein